MSPLFRLSFAFAFSHNVAHSGATHGEEKKKKKKGALRNFSKSETLASERDPGGKKRERGEEEGRWRWREEVVVGGGGSQCGTPEKKLASGLCEPPGAPFSITIGSGAMPTSELPSHIEKRERSVVRGGARGKKRCEKQMCGGGGGERVALNPTHF